MQKYIRLTKILTQEFNQLEFTQVPRSQNIEADDLARQASSKAGPTDTNLKIEVQKHPSIEKVLTFAIQSKSSQMTPSLSVLQDKRLPQDVKKARKVKKRAAKFTILDDTLYKRGFSMPYLKCDNEEEAKYILEKIREGICGDHARLRSLVSKVIRRGYFWLTLQKDAREFVKTCDKCQRFGNVQHIPVEKLTPISSQWPFA